MENSEENKYSDDFEKFLDDIDFPFDDDFDENDEEEMEDEDDDLLKDFLPFDIYSMTPHEIYDKLDEMIYKQEQAKKAVATLVFNHLHGRSRRCVLVGPSGCGKTEIFRAVKSFYRNVYIYDASTITSEGFKGNRKYNSFLSDMLMSGFTPNDVEHSIMVFDEFDKLVTPKTTSSGENVNYEIQGQFLSMVEGTDINVKYRSGDFVKEAIINTSNMSFVFLGAFEGIKMGGVDQEEKEIGFEKSEAPKKSYSDITIQDMIDYGMRPELAGRISNISRLEGFNKTDYINILKNNSAGIIDRIAYEYGMDHITLSEKTIETLADEAEKTGLGIRYLMSEVIRLLDESAFEDGIAKDSL